MTDLDIVKGFATEAHKLAQEATWLATMAKQANADLTAARAVVPEKELDAQKLQKAASAVASLYGDRASVTPDNLMKIWGADKNTLVDSLFKVASDSIAKKVQEPAMVSVKKPAVVKSASGYSAVSVDAASHRKSFDEIFGIVRK